MQGTSTDKRTSQSPDGPKTYSAEKARQGTIILRHRWSRWLFILGLVAAVVLAFFTIPQMPS
ncbi:hypothetical protein SAMN04488061_1230 [Filomicrobium insigne]|uniref:Peptide ABC transporter permease n=2 Tax=Filomicrobium TaxID=119044 RepID=A0A0D6JAE9_9HYPH|nr:protein of unknown function [Candidatus Filomicrobium marinum]SDO61832.1 hypothetical protein SAMN04488061_1230 [Filomicrobium insigne]